MKKIRKQWPYYRRRIYFVLLILSFVLGVHGLYVYYVDLIPQSWQLLSTMLYGTMKLYLFAPPLPAVATVSWTYEVAKWLAPLLTSALVLTALTNRLRHWRNSVRNLRGKRLLVFGLNDLSESFLRNLHAEGSRYRLSVIHRKKISDEEQKVLEKRYTSVHISDIEKMSDRELKGFLSGLGMRRLRHLLFMEEKPVDNVALLLRLFPYLPDQKIDIHLRLSNPALAKTLQDELDAWKAKGRLARAELLYFDPASLSVDHLFRQGNTGYFLQRISESIRSQRDKAMTSAEALMQMIPKVHAVIFGLNDLTLPIIRRCINDMVISEQKIRFSLVDENADTHLRKLLYNQPQLEMAAEFYAYDARPSHNGFLEIIQDIEKQPMSFAFLNFEDGLLNLEVFQYIRAHDPTLPVAFRIKDEQVLKEILVKENVLFYGDSSEIMSSEVVLQESLERHAQNFNEAYNEASVQVGAKGGASWESLSTVKKMSSRQSAAHAETKEVLMMALFDQSRRALREKVLQLASHLKEIREQYPGDRFREGMRLLLDEEPYAEYLSRLEHKRWCHAYYLMGFRLGETKDELKKTHPCLQEDWERVMGDLFFQCHPEYDLLSILPLFSDGSNTLCSRARLFSDGSNM